MRKYLVSIGIPFWNLNNCCALAIEAGDGRITPKKTFKGSSVF
jgi:hypothetical protein